LDEDTLVTMHFARIRPPDSLLPWGLTACGVIAGPSLLHAAQTAPALTMVSVAIGLTALLIGLTLRQRGHHVGVAAPVRRRIGTLACSPP
jgi:hypothetical protein